MSVLSIPYLHDEALAYEMLEAEWGSWVVDLARLESDVADWLVHADH